MTTQLSNAKENKPILRVATAANFAPVLKKIAPQMEQTLSLKIQIISGSSGTLFLQIMHGAPFDVFLSADSIHPKKLVTTSHGLANTLTTYTQGQLSFYSAKHPSLTFTEFIQNISNYSRIAIANPEIAPYGKAAKEVLTNHKIWSDIAKQRITSINVGQTYQQIKSKAVDAGFIATSQLALQQKDYHHTIIATPALLQQQAVVLTLSSLKEKASQFIDLLTQQHIQQQLIKYGYRHIHASQHGTIING